MSVKVKVPLDLQKFTAGREIVEVTGKTVGDCLDGLQIQFPRIKQQLCDEQGRLLNFYYIFVNSDSPYPVELAKPVKDGDVLSIVPLVIPIGGG